MQNLIDTAAFKATRAAERARAHESFRAMFRESGFQHLANRRKALAESERHMQAVWLGFLDVLQES